MSLIVYIDNLNHNASGKYDNLPDDTEYLIISCLRDFIETPVLSNLPIGLKKIIIIDYEKTITFWSGYKNVEEYIEYLTDGKIPFGCKVETIQDEKEGYSEEMCYFTANPDLIFHEERLPERLFKLNNRVDKGTYDYIYYNYNHEVEEIKDFIHIDGKKYYIRIGI